VEQYGTQYYELSSRGGRVIRDSSTIENPAEQLNYKQALTCTATAYDLSFNSCGKNPGDPYYGVAASGMRISRGIVAVDPRVIPMGSKLYIESLDSWPDYGFAIAGDKGGAIKGNKVDLFMESSSEVRQFGRRKVNVYILDN
jgi:3D (Asp-Asp-Asp) domain-containing protein